MMAQHILASNTSVDDLATSVCADIPSNCECDLSASAQPQAQTATNLELDVDGRDLVERAVEPALPAAVEEPAVEDESRWDGLTDPDWDYDGAPPKPPGYLPPWKDPEHQLYEFYHSSRFQPPSEIRLTPAPSPAPDLHNLGVALEYARHGLAVSRVCGGCEPDGSPDYRRLLLSVTSADDLENNWPPQVGAIEAPVKFEAPGRVESPTTNETLIRQRWAEYPGALPAVHLGEKVFVLDFPNERLPQAQSLLAQLTDVMGLNVITPHYDLRVVYRHPQTPAGMRLVTCSAKPFPGAVQITDRVVLDGAYLADHISDDPYTLVRPGPHISLRDGDPVSAIPEMPAALFNHLGYSFEAIPVPPPPPPVQMAAVSLDLEDRALIDKALALSLPLEVVSFGDGDAPTQYFHDDTPRNVGEPSSFSVSVSGRVFRSQREASCDPAVVLGKLPKHQTGRGHIITAALGEKGARLIPVVVGWLPDPTPSAREIAAALKVPLESVIVECREDKLMAVGIVVDDASLRALFYEAGLALPTDWRIGQSDRIILPGLPHAPGDDRYWEAPAGLDAFLRALAAAPAKASPELASYVSNPNRLPQLLREYMERKAADQLSVDHAAAYSPIPVTRASLLADPPRPDHVAGILPRGVVGVFYGSPGCGKTFALLSIGALAARGLTPDSQPCLVIYASGDDDRGDLGLRADAMRQLHGLTEADPFYVWSGVPDLRDPLAVASFTSHVADLVERHPGLPVIIILETLSDILGVDGDDASRLDIKAVLASCRGLSRRFGDATVVIAHHTTKGGDVWRGDSSILANTAFLVSVEAKGNDRTQLTAERIKSGPSGSVLIGRRAPAMVSLDDGTRFETRAMEWISHSPPGAARASRQATDGHPYGADESEGQGGDTPPSPGRTRETALLQAVRDCLERELIEHDDGTGHRVMAAHADAVREAFRVQVYGDADTRPDTVRKAFRRSLDDLSGSDGPLRTSADRKLLWLPEPEPAVQD